MSNMQNTRGLFEAVVDLTPSGRVAYYRLHNIPEEQRSEVDSLLEFVPKASELLTDIFANGAVTAAAKRQRFGSFETRQLLGQGGMSTVWLAERVDGVAGQKAAVKLLHASSSAPKMRERFRQERQILAALSHPNIARLIDGGETADGHLFLVLDYVNGEPIDAYCRDFDVAEKLRVFLEVCAAVAYAHRTLVVHRDLKPSNILVDRETGQPRLLDFGISKMMTPDVSTTRTVDRMLTPEYASPEQVTGEETGTACDIYSLGAILYKLLTGHPPHEFAGSQAADLATVICRKDVTRPSRHNPAISGDLEAILLKSLRKEPFERYSSVDKMAEDIKAFLEHRPVAACTGGASYRGRRFLRRHWIGVVAAAVAMTGLLSGLVVAEKERRAAVSARAVAEAKEGEANTQRAAAQRDRDNAARERAKAVEQAEAARQQREEATRQRSIAERRFIEARQLALHLADFDTEIRGLDNATKARQALVTTALAYLEKLRADAPAGDTAYWLELASAYERVADVQAGAGHPNLGQKKEAFENLAKAEQMLNGVSRNDPRAYVRLAANLDTQARIAGSDRNWAETVRRAERGLEFAKLARASVRSAEDRLNQSRIEGALEYSLQGGYTNVDRTQDALTHGKRSVELTRQVFETAKTPAAEANYARSASAYAATLRFDGRLDEALAPARAARDVYERQYRASPSRAAAAGLQYSLLTEAKLLGQYDSVSLGRNDDAAKVYERALALSRERAKADAQDWGTRALLAQGAEGLAGIRLDSDPATALALYDEAYAVRTQIPASNGAHEERLYACSGSVRALARLGRYDEADRRLVQLFDLLRKTASAAEGVPGPGTFLANAVRAKAELAAARGALSEALRSWNELATAFAASKEKPEGDLHWALRFAEVYRALAVLYDRQGSQELSRQWRGKSRALWKEWDRKMPGNPFIRNQLARD